MPTVAKQTGVSTSQATTIQHRPALIQELTWNPQSLGWSPKAEAAQEVVFSFFDGQLFRIVVHYDRYETEGLTSKDIVDAMSLSYGPAVKPSPMTKALLGVYDEPEETVARWEDPLYRFDLIRSLQGPSFRLVGVLKRLEAPAQASILEAKRLDDQEAPQRDAARIAGEEETARAGLENARLVNKAKFRP